MSKNSLFDEFDEVSAKAWKQKIQFDLKGEDYNDSLVWETAEGIKVKPFYNHEDLKNDASAGVSPPSPWHIAQAIYAGNAALANAKAIKTVADGAQSLIFIVPSKDIDIKNLQAGDSLRDIPIHFQFQFLDLEYLEQYIAVKNVRTAPTFFNLDIVGNLARTGNWFFNLNKDHEVIDKILQKTAHKDYLNVLGVDISLYQNAGANSVQELAYGLAHANEYLNRYKLDASQQITFTISVGGNYFLEIAKLRALRLLWRTLAAEYGVNEECHIIAKPSRRNKTLYDYNVNMLRTTMECMSAIIGGANTVCNLPYDAIYHKENEFGERIAKNQLLILQHESYFDKVANPADGSYYITSLTTQLSQKALQLFKDIEKNGGFLKQLKEHTIQKKIKESADKEQQLFNEKKQVLVGANSYILASDTMKTDLELYPFMKRNSRKTLLEPILERRLAEDLEQKRLKDE
ncbi:methylmalonyl-CoA mutase subunit beta [Spongiimicrobium sp. 3-5]|uniref:methylmalonyl-CoA mutase subunit beta n=1 Tax=Spongiimicrobium sp. 3-5 TaxID=3332596 RepID=UPI00397FECC2